MWARFITTDYVVLLFFAVLYHVYGGDAQTDSPREECESKLKTYRISLLAVSSVAGLIIIVMSVVITILVKSLRSRKSPESALHSNDPVQPRYYATFNDSKESAMGSIDSLQPRTYAITTDDEESAIGSIDSLQPRNYAITTDDEESAKGSIDSLQSGNHAISKDDEVSREEVAELAYTVTIRHCKKIFEAIESPRRRKDVPINFKPYQNEEVLFKTREMIKDWLDRQKCSNSEKRRRLENAITDAQSSAYSELDEELFSAKVIKKRVSGDKSKIVAVAYDLLMTDIKPFAKALGVEDDELKKYDLQSSNPKHLAKGTIGLVNLLLK